MSEDINRDRRAFLSNAAFGLAAAELAMLGSANAQPGKPAPSLHAAFGFGPPRQIQTGLLNIGYAEAGPANGPVVLLLHGWPYDIHSFVDVSPLLAAHGYRVIVPYLRGYGATHFLSPDTFRNGEPAALATDIIDMMDALQIRSAIIGGFDWGARTADIIAARWPERCKALVSVSGYLVGSQKSGRAAAAGGRTPMVVPVLFRDGSRAPGYDKYRHDFAKLIWSKRRRNGISTMPRSIAAQRLSKIPITSPS